jgi:hypothetical protein
LEALEKFAEANFPDDEYEYECENDENEDEADGMVATLK